MSCDQIQKIFDQKELQIKMFYVLNVSNPNSKPQEFSLKDIEVLKSKIGLGGLTWGNF